MIEQEFGHHLGELADMQDRGLFPEPRHLWGPLITEACLVLLYAPRGLGKTFFAMKLAHAIAAGTQFLKWRGAGGVRVLYFDGEMGYGPITRRFTSIDESAEQSVVGGAIRVISYSSTGGMLWNLSSVGHQDMYKQAMRDYQVIIIDNLLTATRPEDRFDDESKQWNRIQAFLIRARDAGKTVVLVHHAGKAGSQLGTSQRENVMDSIFALKALPRWRAENDRTSFEVLVEKNRHIRGRDAEPLLVEFGDTGSGLGQWSYRPMREARAEQVRKMRRLKISQRQIAIELGISLSEVAEVLRAEAADIHHHSEADSDSNDIF